MEEFKLVVRTYAFKKKFHLGVGKSTIKKYRGFCKSGDESTGPCLEDKWLETGLAALLWR
jgi:hypothetical protein